MKQQRHLGGIRQLAGAAALLIALAQTAAIAQSPPRYRYQPADRLVYDRHTRTVSGTSETASKTHEQVQIWCLQRHDDDALLVVESSTVVNGRAGKMHGTVLQIDVRGRRSYDPEFTDTWPAPDILCEMLPFLPSAFETGSTWTGGPDEHGQLYHCRRIGPDAQRGGAVRFDFEIEDPAGVLTALDIQKRGRFWFDTDTGLVIRSETETIDNRHDAKKLVINVLYQRLSVVEPRWCQRRLNDLDRLKRVLHYEQRELGEMYKHPATIGQALQAIDRRWAEVMHEIPARAESPLHRLAQAYRRQTAARASDLREQARLIQSWTGSTAADWTFQTPAGESLSSESLRDRHVLEYFWRSDVPASLRGFTNLRELQTQLALANVRIVCLNIDTDVAAGQRTAELCGGKGLTQVLAGAPVGGEPPRQLPILRLIDREGRVLRVYFGFPADLADQIRRLTQPQ